MNLRDSIEMVPPTDICEGDVIEDAVAQRWVTVRGIRMITDADAGAYSFYSNGPGDRVTFEGDELVTRKRQSSVRSIENRCARDALAGR